MNILFCFSVFVITITTIYTNADLVGTKYDFNFPFAPSGPMNSVLNPWKGDLRNVSAESSNGVTSSRNGGKSGSLFPFFRVGRSRSLMLRNGDSKRVTKMTVFPRVGRDFPKDHDDYELENKRSDSNNALWFGPRMGVHKRNNHEIPLNYFEMNDGHGTRTEYLPLFDKEFDGIINHDDNNNYDFLN